MLGACGREEPAWAAARAANTQAAYADYMRRYPAGEHAAEARAAIRALKDDDAWARAERIGSPEAWQRYLADWPEGLHVVLAQQLLLGFIPPESPTRVAPAGPPAQEAPAEADEAATAVVPAPGAYEIQLGAWRDEATAREALAGWQGERVALLEGHAARLVAPFGEGPALWRLRTEPFGEADARALCERIKAAGSDCVPAVALSAGEPPP